MEYHHKNSMTVKKNTVATCASAYHYSVPMLIHWHKKYHKYAINANKCVFLSHSRMSKTNMPETNEAHSAR